jgi:2-polyprenyl-3-methyl-5-hydroxy-6-metoxy-1,4-benzoquinol methylase
MSLFEKQLLNAAIAPYAQAGKFATGFAKGKLSGDPVFKEILQKGLIPAKAHIVDIGCGQGLLAAWLLAAEHLSATSSWPSSWAAAPRGITLQGIELMQSDVERASKALIAHQERLKFIAGDMCKTAFDPAQIAVILDVLHYVPYAAQEDVLARVYAALAPNGMLILRIGDAAAGLPFKMSNWVDHVVTFVRGHRLSRLYCRPLLEWCKLLERLGFDVETKPMSQGTPFGNVLILARIRQS